LLVASGVEGQLRLVTVVWLLLGASVAVLASATVSFVLVLRRTPGHPEERRPLRAIYLSGLPFLVTELTAAAMTMGDVVVLGRSVPHEELALYAAASRVAALIAVPAFVATTVLTPAVASLWAVRQKDRLQVLLRGYGLLAAAPAALALVVVGIAGHHLLGLLFGPYYREGWLYLVVLATGAFLNTVLGFASPVLMTIGEVRVVVRVTVLAAVGTVAAEVAAVRLWGPLGVAAVAALGLFCQQLVLTFVCARRTGLWALPGTSRHVLASLGGGT
jgi:O-antigen/teichoic acid export membrane protein